MPSTCCLLPSLLLKLSEVSGTLGLSGQVSRGVGPVEVWVGVQLRMEVGPGLFTSKPMLILFRFPGLRRIAGQLARYSARTL